MSCFAFDLDGVLILAPLFTENINRVYGVPSALALSFINAEYQDCIVGRKDLKLILPKYLKQWGLTISVEELLSFWFQAENMPNQELIKYIQTLRSQGHYCCILTNQEKYRMKYIREVMDYTKYFDSIHSSCEIGYKKPTREYFRTASQLIGFELKDIHFFDDREKYVAEANRAGIDAYPYIDNKQTLSVIKTILANLPARVGNKPDSV